MFKLNTLAALAATALLASAAQAQARNEGSFDFGRIPGLTGEPTVQIDLGAAMLALVSTATRASDPAAADAMAGIENVRVHVYETVDDPQAVLDFIDDTSGALEKKGWARTVFVQEPGEQVRIYTKLDKTEITGLTLMVFDGEAVFINVAGQINPAQLGQLMNAFGMDGVVPNLGGAGGSTGAAP